VHIRGLGVPVGADRSTLRDQKEAVTWYALALNRYGLLPDCIPSAD
jgi:hypothetical protein